MSEWTRDVLPNNCSVGTYPLATRSQPRVAIWLLMLYEGGIDPFLWPYFRSLADTQKLNVKLQILCALFFPPLVQFTPHLGFVRITKRKRPFRTVRTDSIRFHNLSNSTLFSHFLFRFRRLPALVESFLFLY